MVMLLGNKQLTNFNSGGIAKRQLMDLFKLMVVPSMDRIINVSVNGRQPGDIDMSIIG